jgi:hypothetical protein
MGSPPDEIRVLGLEPIAASPALIEAAPALRHDPLKAKFAGLGEHERAFGRESVKSLRNIAENAVRCG